MLGALLGMLFAFLFGGMVLMLVLGGRAIEEERKREEREARPRLMEDSRLARFFAPALSVAPQTELDEALLLRIEALLLRVEKYLETEQSLADAFVSQPSIENLYRESGMRLSVH